MARYSKEYKQRAVARLLPPESSPIEVVSRDIGVSVDTLERWRSQALAMPESDRTQAAEANDALNKATAANARAEKIEKELIATKAELEASRTAIRKTTNLLFKITKANLENYLIMTSVTLTSGDFNAARVDANIDMFSRLIEPNKEKRELWLKSLQR